MTGSKKKKKKVYLYVYIPTAYNIQGTERNVAEAVKWFSAYMFQHLLDQNFALFIHHLEEVSEDREVKCWGQHFASTAPLVSCAVMCGEQIIKFSSIFGSVLMMMAVVF